MRKIPSILYCCRKKKKKKKWSDEYLDFDIVVRHLKGHNRWFGEFDKIPTEKKNKIFDIIKKDYI